MSSSVLIILLVIVWLFVLAPMLIRTRSPIRRTGDALAQTRTLYSGGSRRLVPRRAHPVADPVDLADAEESLFGLPSGQGSTDYELVDPDEWMLTLETTLRRDAAQRRGEAVRIAMETRLSAESENDHESPTRLDLSGAAAEHNDADFESDTEPLSAAQREAAEAAARPMVVDGELIERGVARRIPKPKALGDVENHDDHELHERRRHPLHRSESDVELTPEDLDFAQRRRGRGAYDPMADRAAADKRYRARQRTALILLVMVVGFSVAAFFTTAQLWWGTAVSVLLLGAYLAYLRRQVRLEENLRRRRIERMRRARLGVESRDDAELEVVPPRLRRPGAVVLEIDDEDPVFDVLDDPTTVFEETIPTRPQRRAGGDHDHRHPVRRAVG